MGRCCVTSRDASWEQHATLAELEVFTPEEAVAFLLTRSGSGDEQGRRRGGRTAGLAAVGAGAGRRLRPRDPHRHVGLPEPATSGGRTSRASTSAFRRPSQPAVRICSTNSKRALRAAACGGRPRAGSDPTVTGESASPSTPGGTKPDRRRTKIVPVSARRRTLRRLVAQPPGRIDVLLRAIAARGTLVIKPVLGTPTTTGTPSRPNAALILSHTRHASLTTSSLHRADSNGPWPRPRTGTEWPRAGRRTRARWSDDPAPAKAAPTSP